MKYIPNILGGLLGVAFIAFSVMFFFNLMKSEPPVPGSLTEHFMTAVGPTGYMHFVKICELIGGILCAIPLTRNIGLLFLGPVILNILAFHTFVAKDGIDPVTGLIAVLAAYLLWAGRKNFAALLNR